MRAIATKAGTSLANLYNYVPSKEALLAELLRAGLQELLGQVRGSVGAAGDDPVAQMGAAVRAYILWSAHSQATGVVALSEFRYLTGDERSDIVAARDEVQHIFTDIAERGVAAGVFGTPYPRHAARNIAQLCSAFALWYRADGGETPEALAEINVRLALGMVEASPN